MKYYGHMEINLECQNASGLDISLSETCNSLSENMEKWLGLKNGHDK